MQKIEFATNTQNIENLQKLASSIPGPIYWKDKNGIYLGMNRFALEASGLEYFSNFIGKRDHDLWPKFADKIVSNDQKIIQTGETIHEEGAINLPNGEIKYYKAIKVPLRNDNNDIVGVIGNYIDNTDIVKALNPCQNNIKISKRELACINLLKEGLSSKQIAIRLNLSKRTVEQYIDTAKNKLGCKNSVELVYKCFKDGRIR